MEHRQSSGEEREARIGEWIRDHSGQVYRTALYFMKDHAAAEDIVQETFLLAYRHMDEFRGTGSPAGWLIRIAANRARDELRTRWHRDVSKMGDWEAQAAMIAGDPPPDRTVADRDELVQALARLDDRLRRSFLLHYFYGFRDREIAAIENLTPAAVRKRLERGREKLRRMLSDREGDDR